MEKHEQSIEKLLVTLDETRQMLGGISMGTLYNLRRKKAIKILKIGSRSFVERKAIEDLVARLSESVGPEGKQK